MRWDLCAAFLSSMGGPRSLPLSWLYSLKEATRYAARSSSGATSVVGYPPNVLYVQYSLFYAVWLTRHDDAQKAGNYDKDRGRDQYCGNVALKYGLSLRASSQRLIVAYRINMKTGGINSYVQPSTGIMGIMKESMMVGEFFRLKHQRNIR